MVCSGGTGGVDGVYLWKGLQETVQSDNTIRYSLAVSLQKECHSANYTNVKPERRPSHLESHRVSGT